MKLKKLIAPVLLGASILAATTLSCEKRPTKYEPVYEYFADIFGNWDYEADGDYPPPDSLDNYRDDNIIVALKFTKGFDNGKYKEGDVYAYEITEDTNYTTHGDKEYFENFRFKYIPEGWFYMTADLDDEDYYYHVVTDDFYHEKNVTDDFGLLAIHGEKKAPPKINGGKLNYQQNIIKKDGKNDSELKKIKDVLEKGKLYIRSDLYEKIKSQIKPEDSSLIAPMPNDVETYLKQNYNKL